MNIFRAIRDRLARIDEVVPVLVFFEIIYLAVGQLIIWAFLPVDKPYVAIGFAIGVGFAVLSSISNSMILGRALSRGKRKAASAGMIIFMLVRIAAISAIIVLALKFKFCSAVAVLIGVLAIQAGVYFEPMVRKRRERKMAKDPSSVSCADSFPPGGGSQADNEHKECNFIEKSLNDKDQFYDTNLGKSLQCNYMQQETECKDEKKLQEDLQEDKPGPEGD